MPISLGGLLHGWMTMAMANESQEQARRMRRHPTWDDKPLLAKFRRRRWHRKVIGDHPGSQNARERQ
jgi:hypothetical protein